MKMKMFFLSAIAGLFVILLAACGGNQQTETKEASGQIQIDGSSTVYPITEAVAEEFRKSKPEIKISVALSGTGGGFKKFGRGEIDINDASRPIKPAEDSLAKAHNIQYTGLTIAYDGLAVLVNPEN